MEAERLKELNKMKSFFVSTVSHDLKTPLTSIKMFSEILQTNKNISPDKTDEYLQIIEGESNRLTRLINNVLDYTKIEKGIKEYHFESANIITIVKDVLRSMEYQFKMEKFTVNTSFSEDEKIILGDKDAITEALINLLSNSIKYSSDNKTITVSTFSENNHYCITVEDKGIGIKETELKNIFIPYFRSKEESTQRHAGAGLGLAIIKHTMNAHKGKIEIKSRLGEGSSFTLLFPIKI